MNLTLNQQLELSKLKFSLENNPPNADEARDMILFLAHEVFKAQTMAKTLLIEKIGLGNDDEDEKPSFSSGDDGWFAGIDFV
jgi:hypothetical protein